MSAYKEYLEEKQHIDALIAEGYHITAISSSLSGDTVRFLHPVLTAKELLVCTADARKYITVLLLP